MYCSQCGKKVKENMLFCPFCGSPIVIPEQDEDRQVPESAAQSEPKSEQKESSVHPAHSEKESTSAPESLDAHNGNEKSEFIPLDLESQLKEPPSQSIKKSEVTSRQVSDILSKQLQEEPVRLQGRKPDLSATSHGAPKIPSRKAADTLVPSLKFDPDNMFLDEEEDEDDFDDYDEEELDYEFEEPEHGSFFIRHIRGFVTLILFGVVALVILGWALSAPGQQSLARSGLAWNSGVYAEVAFDAYQKGSYAQAGNFYKKAFEHNTGNYDYANSAGVSYYMANDNFNAEIMARKAIDVNPSRPEAYELLLRLYPDADGRSLEITGLIQAGYRLTGNESLNIR